ncbi:MAG: hypothetical protein EAZ15_09320 [Sphingobacteriales bacterium]|nr:MAG: hypothetical protein EAZ15_09320 [Sphingobacteriales bacterium]
MQILLNVTDNKADLLLEFLKSLNYVITAKKVNTDTEGIIPIKNLDFLFDLDDSIIAKLDKRALTPNHDCLSLEESNLKISGL